MKILNNPDQWVEDMLKSIEDAPRLQGQGCTPKVQSLWVSKQSGRRGVIEASSSLGVLIRFGDGPIHKVSKRHNLEKFLEMYSPVDATEG